MGKKKRESTFASRKNGPRFNGAGVFFPFYVYGMFFIILTVFGLFSTLILQGSLVWTFGLIGSAMLIVGIVTVMIATGTDNETNHRLWTQWTRTDRFLYVHYWLFTLLLMFGGRMVMDESPVAWVKFTAYCLSVVGFMVVRLTTYGVLPEWKQTKRPITVSMPFRIIGAFVAILGTYLTLFVYPNDVGLIPAMGTVGIAIYAIGGLEDFWANTITESSPNYQKWQHWSLVRRLGMILILILAFTYLHEGLRILQNEGWSSFFTAVMFLALGVLISICSAACRPAETSGSASAQA